MMTDPRGDWLLTASGRQVWLLDPQPADIDSGDIATALARIPRFNGHTRVCYSVAQHSVLVAQLLVAAGHPELALAGLLHDAHEAYVGDWTTPLKRSLRNFPGSDPAGGLALISEGLDRAIAARFGFDHRAFYSPPLKAADRRALATERRDLMPPGGPVWRALAGEEPSDEPLTAWPEGLAFQRFITRLCQLCPSDACRDPGAPDA